MTSLSQKAICSCAVLPLFAGIRRMWAGCGPAINVLAIILTTRILGLKIGSAELQEA